MSKENRINLSVHHKVVQQRYLGVVGSKIITSFEIYCRVWFETIL